MATIRPKVLSTSGHDELLLDADNLKLAAAPTLNEHGTNKAYVDASDTALQNQIDTIDGLYVRDTGDNMTGNLTLGTTQISPRSKGICSRYW